MSQRPSAKSKVPPIPETSSNPRLARHAAERCGRCPTSDVVLYTACMSGKPFQL
eukprot:CAMPEP_0177475644 /NCGR_PEP_ID=MMETSP0369-20130122/23145_1 /TAXON_ID=447022 ORGANISM="Scrippsiella hangoei-like, Strain SHHI-4" /NCGR_SAMPLE_ID=MMETSP0369 /ASSEMBLY_ACC=CAM_ASM_000364 /LENGTH=53 /DNA_ID=CAMNT_0018950785 /DNA_START=94 /DNA_END=252 /DNA_ORIENTATION=-